MSIFDMKVYNKPSCLMLVWQIDIYNLIFPYFYSVWTISWVSFERICPFFLRSGMKGSIENNFTISSSRADGNCNISKHFVWKLLTFLLRLCNTHMTVRFYLCYSVMGLSLTVVNGLHYWILWVNVSEGVRTLSAQSLPYVLGSKSLSLMCLD